jgi:hypothetical protein
LRRWWLPILLLLSVGVNVGVLATLVAQRLRPEGAGAAAADPPPPRLAQAADRLRLGGEPRRRFLAIQQELFASSRADRARLAELRRELRLELAGAEAPDLARVDALLRESAAVQLRLERAFARSVVETRELLDPAQERLYLQWLGRLRPLALAARAAGAVRAPPAAGEAPPAGALDSGGAGLPPAVDLPGDPAVAAPPAWPERPGGWRRREALRREILRRPERRREALRPGAEGRPWRQPPPWRRRPFEPMPPGEGETPAAPPTPSPEPTPEPTPELSPAP